MPADFTYSIESLGMKKKEIKETEIKYSNTILKIFIITFMLWVVICGHLSTSHPEMEPVFSLGSRTHEMENALRQ